MSAKAARFARAARAGRAPRGNPAATNRMKKMALELEKSCVRKDPVTLRPWALSRHKPKWKDPIRRWNIGEGDRVAVIDGPHEGQRGVVQAVLKHKNLVIVDGVNVRRRWVIDEANPDGDRIPKDLPCVIHYSNVNLICPMTDLPTRVRHRFVDGKRLRVAARSGAYIPDPVPPPDASLKDGHLIGDLDTEADDVLHVSYDPLKDRDTWALRYQGPNKTRPFL